MDGELGGDGAPLAESVVAPDITPAGEQGGAEPPSAESDEQAALVPPSSAPVALAVEEPAVDPSEAEPATEPAAAPDTQPGGVLDRAPDRALVPVAPALPGERARRLHAVPLPVARTTAWLLGGAGVALVTAAAGLALALTAGDWGSGARAAGLASLALGIICLGAALARFLRARRLAHLGIAAAVAWGLIGGGTLAAANPLRLAQGHRLEASHNWPGALRAYLLAGEQGPASADPARVYIEWGDDLAARGEYAGAIDRYEQAIVRYPLAGAEMRRAIASLWPVYATWISVPSAALPYAAIIQSLRGYQRDAWCGSDCQTSAAALEAQARFAYGLQLAGEQQFAEAIKWLESVRSADPTSPYVALAHASAATAYSILGQTQLHGPNCPAAVPTYQALASSYQDTAEGKRARAALAAPVRVSGRLTGYPAWPVPTMYLSTKVYSASHFSDDYSAALDGAGNFTFAQVKPGAYNLSAAFGDGSGRYWQSAQTNNVYSVVVAPLCALNLGTYSW